MILNELVLDLDKIFQKDSFYLGGFTDITSAISEADRLQPGAIVLISDGNQG